MKSTYAVLFSALLLVSAFEWAFAQIALGTQFQAAGRLMDNKASAALANLPNLAANLAQLREPALNMAKAAGRVALNRAKNLGKRAVARVTGSSLGAAIRAGAGLGASVGGISAGVSGGNNIRLNYSG